MSKCLCMDWNKKTHKLWSFVSKCPCMDCRSYKTPLLWLFFGTVGTFVAILFICSHTKPIATQEKRHPNLWTKVATRHRFVGLDIPTQPHKLWHGHVISILNDRVESKFSSPVGWNANYGRRQTKTKEILISLKDSNIQETVVMKKDIY